MIIHIPRQICEHHTDRRSAVQRRPKVLDYQYMEVSCFFDMMEVAT